MANNSINIVFTTTSSVAFTAPVQQVTILDSTNKNSLRNMFVSQDGVKLVRGTSQVKIPIAQLYAAAVACDPTMTWPPAFTTQPLSTIVTQPATASFSVVILSELPYGIAWQYNSASNGWANTAGSASFGGSSTTQLTASCIGYTLNGTRFRCIATSSAGTGSSTTSTLTIL